MSYEYLLSEKMLNDVKSLLVGKRVVSVWIESAEQHEMIFLCDDGEKIWWNAWQECCSETWFYSVSGVNNLRGLVVTGVRSLELDERFRRYAISAEGEDSDGLCRQQYDRWYGYAIETARGVCEIEFRNSSNGYYGGDLTEEAKTTVIDIYKYSMLVNDYLATSLPVSRQS